MPMPGNFNWRPNDNSSLTNLRYDLEARKWVNSFRKAQGNLHRGNFVRDLGGIGYFIGLPLCLLFLILLLPIQLIKVIFNYNIKIFPGDEPTGRQMTDREKFYAELEDIRRKHSPRKRRKTSKWEDLTPEERELVLIAKEGTAKAIQEGKSYS